MSHVEGPGKLSAILGHEAGAFHRISNKWRPNNLFLELQTKGLLADMTQRYQELEAAKEELAALVRVEFYLRALRQMKLIVRRANFVRRMNHLAFSQAVTEFYTLYGEVLRYLKIEQFKGHISEPQPV